ncbi:exported hypothetical protein [Candidatus Desulfosporosinus infrequens]|uniref:Uncharacterized protein n=1 Tax=Candidatus Desulfosporosinus infrequens TaxID=2043169 RepID=A0A2U3LA88_9FIRM|nr:exported hypothetical protein [Candidatus Desulfosporosinus infrequens]
MLAYEVKLRKLFRNLLNEPTVGAIVVGTASGVTSSATTGATFGVHD